MVSSQESLLIQVNFFDFASLLFIEIAAMFGIWFIKLHEDVFEPVSHPQGKLSHFKVRTSRNRFASSEVIQLQLVSLFGPLQPALGSKQVTGAGVGLVVSATSLI